MFELADINDFFFFHVFRQWLGVKEPVVWTATLLKQHCGEKTAKDNWCVTHVDFTTNYTRYYAQYDSFVPLDYKVKNSQLYYRPDYKW